MKNYIFLLCIVIFTSLHVFTKDYSLIRSENVTLFSNGSYLLAIQIDSVVYENDEVRYYNHQSVIRKPDTQCYSDKIGSWLGSEITLKDGIWKFKTVNNFYLNIKEDPELFEEWVFAEMEDNFIIYAKYTGDESAEINGINDVVKVITLRGVAIGSGFVPTGVDGLQIKISKNFGLYKLFNFYDFPSHYLKTYTILAVNDSKLQPFSEMDVFDFNIGDEFHISEYSHGYTGKTENQMILKVLEKKFTDGKPIKLEYKFKKIAKTYRLYKPDKIDTTTFTNSFINETYTFDNNDILHFCGNITKYSDNYYDVPYYRITDELTKFGLYYDLPLSNNNPDCYYPILAEKSCNYYYYKGLGGPYYSYFSYESEDRYLAYYKKGAEEYGTPFDEKDLLVSTEDFTPKSIQATYLSMSDEVLFATDLIEDNSKIEIYDFNGRNLQNIQLNSNDIMFKLNVNTYTNGIYFYNIYLQNGKNISKGKFSILR